MWVSNLAGKNTDEDGDGDGAARWSQTEPEGGVLGMAGGTDGDELVLTVRKATFEKFLDGAAASFYVVLYLRERLFWV